MNVNNHLSSSYALHFHCPGECLCLHVDFLYSPKYILVWLCYSELTKLILNKIV
jgi:hypothetical protein